MRLAICTLSAVLLSGCSWMGTGSGSSNSYGYGAGNGCAPMQYGQAGGYNVGANGYGYGAGGCGPAGGYAVAGNGYGQGAGGYGAGMAGHGQGANGYGAGMAGHGQGVNGYGAGMAGHGQGANGYGVGTGGALGLRGVQGAGAYGANGYGAGGTVLSGAAPYGTATGGQVISGGGYTGGGQMVNGQWVQGGAVQTVQGAPIYVPRPYPAYYGVGVGGGLRGASVAMPFGVEAGVGTEIGIGGDIFTGAIAKPSGTNFISALDPVAYKDAYKNAVNYNMAASYDVNPSTTLLASVGYSKAEGERQKVGTINDGALVTEDLFAQWGDLEQVTLEGGVRKYMGGWNNGMSGVRPYVQGTAGFTHNQAVNLVQDSATLAPAALNTQQYIDGGWTPTASGMVGAEMQVGPTMAVGVETGVRWRDDLNTNIQSDDRWSIPVQLRGRVSF